MDAINSRQDDCPIPSKRRRIEQIQINPNENDYLEDNVMEFFANDWVEESENIVELEDHTENNGIEEQVGDDNLVINNDDTHKKVDAVIDEAYWMEETKIGETYVEEIITGEAVNLENSTNIQTHDTEGTSQDAESKQDENKIENVIHIETPDIEGMLQDSESKQEENKIENDISIETPDIEEMLQDSESKQEENSDKSINIETHEGEGKQPDAESKQKDNTIEDFFSVETPDAEGKPQYSESEQEENKTEDVIAIEMHQRERKPPNEESQQNENKIEHGIHVGGTHEAQKKQHYAKLQEENKIEYLIDLETHEDDKKMGNEEKTPEENLNNVESNEAEEKNQADKNDNKEDEEKNSEDKESDTEQEDINEPCSSYSLGKPGKRDMLFIRNVVNEMFRHPASAILRVPMEENDIDLEKYHRMVKNPQDLGAIKRRLHNNEYKNAEDCINDLHIMFLNFYIFFKPDDEKVNLCHNVEKIFLRRITSLKESKNPKAMMTKCWTRSGTSKKEEDGSGPSQEEDGSGPSQEGDGSGPSKKEDGSGTSKKNAVYYYDAYDYDDDDDDDDSS